MRAGLRTALAGIEWQNRERLDYRELEFKKERVTCGTLKAEGKTRASFEWKQTIDRNRSGLRWQATVT